MISETLAGLLMDHYTPSEFILVYRYSHWDPNTGEVVLSSEMYTLEAIRNGLGIPALLLSAQRPAAVSAHGGVR